VAAPSPRHAREDGHWRTGVGPTQSSYGYGSKPWYLVNPKIAGKWMFIPLKMVLIGIDPYPYLEDYHDPFWR
jgi:hypothetical protein